MAVNFDAVLNLSKTGLVNPEQMGYKDSLEIIKDESVKIQKSFVKIGWYLKHIRDNALYKEDGYANINECAADQLGYSQSTVSRLINICEKFSKNHNSPELDEKYAGFDKSQMIEMLPMEPEQMEKVKPDMTIKQIREIKDEGKAGKDETEESDEDSTIPGQTSIAKDFPEYMPSESAPFDDPEEENGNQKYATSHKDETAPEVKEDSMEDAVVDGEYREIKNLEEIVVTQPDDTIHDERWFVEQYVELEPGESAKLIEICRREKNNSDRAKVIQEQIAPYGHHCTSCSEYCFEFHGFAKGIELRVGCEGIHMTYRCLAQELARIAEVATSQPERSAYGLEKTEYPEGSLINTAGCGKYNCFSCAQACNIRQKDRYCVLAPFGDPFPCTTMAVLENLREEMGGKCQFVNNGLASHMAGSGAADPCCRDCKEPCGYRCQRAPVPEAPGEDDAGIQELPDQGSVDEMRLLRDMLEEAKSKQWLGDYKAWGLWYRDENIDVNYYKFDFIDGSRLVVAEYPQRHSYYSREVRDEIFYHLISKNKVTDGEVYDEKYRHAAHSETELVEFLKNLQKKR